MLKVNKAEGRGEVDWDKVPVEDPAFLVQPRESLEEPWEPLPLVKDPLVGKVDWAKVELFSLMKEYQKDLAKRVVMMEARVRASKNHEAVQLLKKEIRDAAWKLKDELKGLVEGLKR